MINVYFYICIYIYLLVIISIYDHILLNSYIISMKIL